MLRGRGWGENIELIKDLILPWFLHLLGMAAAVGNNAGSGLGRSRCNHSCGQPVIASLFTLHLKVEKACVSLCLCCIE